MKRALIRAHRWSADPARKFYLDESGNTGDLVNTDDTFDFGQQPLFVLAGIGLDDEKAFGKELERLRANHRIQGRELKSKSLKNRLDFTTDLIACLKDRRCPIFIEVVDKRFFTCVTMVNHFVIPPVANEFDLRADVIQMKNDVAEYLHALMPLALMRAYIDACAEPSIASTRLAFEALLGWLQCRMPDDSNAGFIHEIVADSFADFEKDAASPQPDVQAYLPVPDLSKAGKPYWILPNLSSFTNIYARINLFRRKETGDVRIIHDEQLQYSHILHDGKRTSEDFAKRGLVWPIPHADYGFTEGASLTFAASDTSSGIQAADVVAGFVMRYVQGINYGATIPSHQAIKAFQRLQGMAEPERGTGLNFVVSHRDFVRFGLIQAR